MHNSRMELHASCRSHRRSCGSWSLVEGERELELLACEDSQVAYLVFACLEKHRSPSRTMKSLCEDPFENHHDCVNCSSGQSPPLRCSFGSQPTALPLPRSALDRGCRNNARDRAVRNKEVSNRSPR